MTPSQAVRRVWSATFAIWILSAVVALPAFAHAALLSATVRDGDVFRAAPETVTLTFSETVTLPRVAAELFDADAIRIGGVHADVAAATVTVGLPALADGAYVLTVTVISQDGHQIRSPFRFTVGDAPPVSAEQFDAAVTDANRDPTRPWVTLLRVVTYSTAVIALGMMLAAQSLLAPSSRRAVRRFAARLAAVGAVASVAGAVTVGWWLFQPSTAGAFVDMFTSTAVRGFGLRGVALLGLALVAVWLPAATWLAALTVVASFVLDGHQLTFGVPWQMLIADTVHLGAASVWAGGVALLWWLSRHEPAAVPPVAARVSNVAALTAGLTVASGAVMAVQLIDTPGALLTTRYGNLLAAKLVVVACIGVLAFRLRRAVAANATGSGAFSRRVKRDVAAFVAVLSLTAVLVGVSPLGADDTPAVIQRATFGPHTLEVVVEPATADTHVVHAYLIGADGGFAPVATLSLDATFVGGERDVGPFVVAMAWVSDGHFLAVTDVFTFPGTWELTFTAPLDRFTVATETVTVAVA